jgi:hypothetical protein
VVGDALMAFVMWVWLEPVDDHFRFEVRYRVCVGLRHHVCMHACMGVCIDGVFLAHGVSTLLCCLLLWASYCCVSAMAMYIA